MYIQFNFRNGGNPYVTMNNNSLWNMVKKYYLEQIGKMCFDVIGRAEVWTANTGRKLTAYEKNQTLLREFAIDWQRNASELNYSYGELADWQEFFSDYGKKYGLLREFRENAIC